MPPTLFRLPKAAALSVSALVVEPHLPHLLFVLSSLSALGFDVTVAETFKDAKAVLAASRPALLLTDVRLREYNGLHLVLRGRSAWGDLPAIVTSRVDDPVLRAEAEQLHATFVTLPISEAEMMAAIQRTTLRPANESAGTIRPPFERRVTSRRVAAASDRTEPDRRTAERRRDFVSHLTLVHGRG